MKKWLKKVFESIKNGWFMGPIKKAIESCADNGGKKKLGLYEAKKAREAGHSKEACMIAGVIAATDDLKKRQAAKEVYKDAVKTRRIGTFIFPSVAAILVIVVMANSTLASTLPASVSGETDSTVPTTVSAFVKAMGAHGWVENTDYKFVYNGQTDGTANASPGDYAPDGLYNQNELLYFLTSTENGKAAHAAMVSVCKETNPDGELDTTNYRFIVTLCDFEYQSNTGIKNGKIYPTGKAKKGHAGEIFILYISPTTGVELTIRAGCGNIQFLFPVKIESETTTITTGTETTTNASTTTSAPTTNGTTKALGYGAFTDNNTVNSSQGEDVAPSDDDIGVWETFWNLVTGSAGSDDPGDNTPLYEEGASTYPATTRYIPPVEPTLTVPQTTVYAGQTTTQPAHTGQNEEF